MNILVTGGAGFIGSTLVDRLVVLGHRVTVIDNESSESNDRFYYNDDATYYRLDVSDYGSTRGLYDSKDYVFHLAAESRIHQTIENPLLAVKTNTNGTATVLQSSREAGVKRGMYSSTSAAYGLKNIPPLNESMPEDCLNPYSVTKVAGEKLCKMYSDLYGLETVVFRYFNVFGPREPIKGPYAPVIGLFLRKHSNNEPLTIVGDGLQSRDFVHVEDVVDANIRAMNYQGSIDMVSGAVYNVGTGVKHTVLELAQQISDNIVHIPPRPGEARETLADNIRIQETFGWKSRYNIRDYIQEQLMTE